MSRKNAAQPTVHKKYKNCNTRDKEQKKNL